MRLHCASTACTCPAAVDLHESRPVIRTSMGWLRVSHAIKCLTGWLHCNGSSEMHGVCKLTSLTIPTPICAVGTTVLQQLKRQQVHCSFAFIVRCAAAWTCSHNVCRAARLLMNEFLIDGAGRTYGTVCKSHLLLTLTLVLTFSPTCVRVGTTEFICLAAGGGSPPDGWPLCGEVTFEGVSACYRPGLPPVLSQLSFTIKVRLVPPISTQKPSSSGYLPSFLDVGT